MNEPNKQLMQDAFRKGKYSKALKIAENYLKKCYAYDWDALYMKASILALPHPKFSDYFTAVGLAFYALENDLKDYKRWLGAASICDRCGLYYNAERCYRKAIEIGPADYDALISLASRKDSPGTNISKSEAKEFLEKAISIKPDHWNAYHHLALLMIELGDKKKARELFQKALDRYPVENDKLKMFDEIKRQMERDT
ncbi:MAG: tetratricopeptide repeat protein [Planctomycetota bacterium]